ncbi:hypothetical protein FCS83_07750 [Oenococcus sp. UCMA 17063]|nr:hypothetical protein [Oenococcus sp. UCMA 17063]
MKNKSALMRIMFPLVIIATFLPHEVNGNSKNFRMFSQNYWQLIIRANYFFVMILLLIFALISFIFLIKGNTRKFKFFGSLVLTIHISILTFILGSSFEYLYRQQNLISYFFSKDGVLYPIVVYAWGLLLDLLLSITLLIILARNIINQRRSSLIW